MTNILDTLHRNGCLGEIFKKLNKIPQSTQNGGRSWVKEYPLMKQFILKGEQGMNTIALKTE